MARHLPSIPMSQIIASDAPLLSPVSAGAHDPAWDHFYSPTATDYAFNYYSLPPSPPNSVGSTSSDSPVPAARMLKSRMTPDSGSECEQQLCLPTHQVFDFPEALDTPSPPSTSSSSSPSQSRPSISINTTMPASKRSCSPAPSIPKKPRAVGERINSKDFIPPDVSGLSKREARLVKNRAAAFLSRQRKREEFELMEVRVAELEQENARLLALTKKGNNSSRPDSDGQLLSEIEHLRAKLAAAEDRERELAHKAAAPVKLESPEPKSPPSPPRTAQTKSALGLMPKQVLLCALPTLLSNSSFPMSASSALPPSSSVFDYNSFIPNEYDWSRQSGNVLMDLDIDDQGRISTPAHSQKLEFADIDSAALSGMDISFDTSPADGKIRVRIHPSSSASPPSSSSPTASSSSSLAMWAGQELSPTFPTAAPQSHSFDFSHSATYPPSSSASSSSAGDADQLGPFLGVGTSSAEFGLSAQYASDSSIPPMYGPGSSSPGFPHLHSPVSSSAFTFQSDFNATSGPTPDLNKRRVRIALKTMPTAEGEGGEWEVQLC